MYSNNDAHLNVLTNVLRVVCKSEIRDVLFGDDI